MLGSRNVFIFQEKPTAQELIAIYRSLALNADILPVYKDGKYACILVTVKQSADLIAIISNHGEHVMHFVENIENRVNSGLNDPHVEFMKTMDPGYISNYAGIERFVILPNKRKLMSWVM